MRRLLVLVASVAALVGSAAPGARADAPWCGGDQVTADRPDVVTGPQLHLIYAYPADGGNAFGPWSAQIVSDISIVDAWWRREDPVRTPRWDLAAFPGCPPGFGGADITVVQLPQTMAQLTPNNGRFEAIRRAVPPSDRWKKVVVYYDGILDDPLLCGTAGGSPTTGVGSLAVIYPRSSCGGSSARRAAVLAHELSHELGILPRGGPPNACPGDPGHVCDNGRDLLYPFLSVSTIEELVLDAGRNDYYRHSGSWFDLATSAWLRRLEAPPQPLTVAISGGVGSVTSDAPGVSCTASCTTAWDIGSTIRLTALPDDRDRFLGWRGACSGFECTVTVSGPLDVEAVFGPPQVRVAVRVRGQGRVTGPGIACPRDCAGVVPGRGVFALRARPQKGWRLAAWSGRCRGTVAICRIAPTADLDVGARFVRSR